MRLLSKWSLFSDFSWTISYGTLVILLLFNHRSFKLLSVQRRVGIMSSWLWWRNNSVKLVNCPISGGSEVKWLWLAHRRCRKENSHTSFGKALRGFLWQPCWGSQPEYRSRLFFPETNVTYTFFFVLSFLFSNSTYTAGSFAAAALSCSIFHRTLLSLLPANI